MIVSEDIVSGIIEVMIELFQIIGFAVLAFMIGFYILSLVRKDMSIVDIAWGLGFILVSWMSAYMMGATWPLYLLCCVVTIWGLRLAGHILLRKLKHPGEDWRYAKWRQDWGSNVWWRSFVQVFLLQGIVMIVIALPILLYASNQLILTPLFAYIGASIWLSGFLFETVADAQLQDFIKNRKQGNEVMTEGLWRYSRHPNYFGEAVQWWGIWLIALVNPALWWTILSPLTITFFLRFVSGVPMLEKKYSGRPSFEAYKQKTNVFVPLPPKK